jgi:hypothetical protein
LCLRAATSLYPDRLAIKKMDLWREPNLQLLPNLQRLYDLESTMLDRLTAAALTLPSSSGQPTLDVYKRIVSDVDAEACTAKQGLSEYFTLSRWSLPQHKAYIRGLVRLHWRVRDRLIANNVPEAQALLGDFVDGLGETLNNLRWLTTIFICYAHKDIVPDGVEVDDTYLEDLRAATEGALDKEHVFLWWDRKPIGTGYSFWGQGIRTGFNWEEEIKFTLRHCDLALSLLSPRFHASKFIQKKELFRILRGRTRNGQCLLPIRLEKCDSEENIEIAKTQWFPPDDYIRQFYDSNKNVVKMYAEDLVPRVLNAMEMLSDPAKIDEFINSYLKKSKN